MPASDAFKNSYLDFKSYPRNLIFQGTYPPALEAHAARLDDASSALFKGHDTDADIRFRDLDPDGERKASPSTVVRQLTPSDFNKQNIYSDNTLKDWLGDQSKKDPKCRFM